MERYDIIRTHKMRGEESSHRINLNLEYKPAAKWLKQRFEEELLHVNDHERVRFKWLAPACIEFYIVIANESNGVQREIKARLVEVD